MFSKKTRVRAVQLTIRFREDLNQILNDLTTITKMDRRTIMEMAFADFEKNINDNTLKYGDLDLKEYARLVQSDIINKMKGLERNTFLRENLAINNIKRDIFKLIAINKKVKSKNEIIKLIEQYIEIKKREISHYTNKDILTKEIDFYEKQLKERNIDSIYSYLDNQIEYDKNKLGVK
jgi:hypothetical protein